MAIFTDHNWGVPHSIEIRGIREMGVGGGTGGGGWDGGWGVGGGVGSLKDSGGKLPL